MELERLAAVLVVVAIPLSLWGWTVLWSGRRAGEREERVVHDHRVECGQHLRGGAGEACPESAARIVARGAEPMLFKTRFHAGLRDGSIDLTFRRWSKPQVKVGGTYRLAGGPDVLVVESVEKVAVGSIDARDVKRAGFESLDELKAALRKGDSKATARTNVHRVAFRYEKGTRKAAPAATADDVAALVARLARMDRLSTRGPWTKQVLALIAKNPQRRAGDLAPMVDRELRAFKADVRKLKGMGLTKSFEVGYELTALGRRVLAQM